MLLENAHVLKCTLRYFPLLILQYASFSAFFLDDLTLLQVK